MVDLFGQVTEPEALSSELLTEDAVLLLEVLDRLLLVTVHPAGDEQHQELQREPVHESRLTRTWCRSRRAGRTAAQPADLMKVSRRPSLGTLRDT